MPYASPLYWLGFDRWYVCSGMYDSLLDRAFSLVTLTPEPLLMRTTVLHRAVNLALCGHAVFKTALEHAMVSTWHTGPSIPLKLGGPRVS